jgi:uncharacterized membrane protein
MAWLLPGARTIGNVTLDVHTLLYASLAVTVGFQSMLFWMFAKLYGMREGVLPWDARFRSVVGVLTLEVGLVTGFALLVVGLGLGISAFASWNIAGLGVLKPSETMRLVIPSATAITLGLEIGYGSFFLSVLEIRSTRPFEARARQD